MIKRPEIESLKGHTVQVKYRTSGNMSGKKIPRTMTGTIKSIGIRNVHVERESGREYRIPIQAVSAISEVVA